MEETRERTGWRVRVDGDRCIGSGLCAGSMPDRFRFDGSVSAPVDEHIAPDDDLLYVVDTCPSEAISVWDEAGTRLAP